MAVNYNGAIYYYVTNVQGDVIAILDSNKTTVAKYTYDAWGRILDTDFDSTIDIGTINPLRYRGYVYDTEVGLYYLQSRYYNPTTGRFLNADAFVATGQGLFGNNMFLYCQNSPVLFSDYSGYRMVLRSTEMLGGIPYIVDQYADHIGDKDLGITRVKHGGCGVVATYNALIDLGVPQSFDDVLDYYNNPQESRLTLSGLLGILPCYISEYFENQGYRVIITDNWDAIDLYSRTADACIMYYGYYGGSLLKSGAHYVSYRRSREGYVGLNTSENKGIYHFDTPSSFGHAKDRVYSAGIFVYRD